MLGLKQAAGILFPSLVKVAFHPSAVKHGPEQPNHYYPLGKGPDSDQVAN